jgi:hypothetical protein
MIVQAHESLIKHPVNESEAVVFARTPEQQAARLLVPSWTSADVHLAIVTALCSQIDNEGC